MPSLAWTKKQGVSGIDGKSDGKGKSSCKTGHLGTKKPRWKSGFDTWHNWSEARMINQEWTKTLEDRRRVQFCYQELPGNGAFLTAQLAGNEVVYSVILARAKNPLSREEVESHFAGELSKK